MAHVMPTAPSTPNAHGRPLWRDWRQRLLPLSNGPQEIRSLDGLRAVAALSVVFFHSIYSVAGLGGRTSLLGYDVTFLWSYGQTGVHLFFILSGFLLFAPYAKSMLQGTKFPSTRLFYERRILRIFPAYVVCLTILVIVQYQQFLSLTGAANIGLHLIFFHDDVPAFNRSIEGPFWTLAVEAQFYLILPLVAWVMSRLVGKTRSRERLIISVLGLIGFGLGLRMVDVVVYGKLPLLSGGAALIAWLFVFVTYGSQGKYLEVFALGALCVTIYQIINEESRALQRAMRWVGLALFIGSFPLMFALARLATTTEIETPILAGIYHVTDFMQIGGPLAVGFGYAMLLMGVLWSGGWVRALFEAWPLRFVGLISYSLYLWHQPIIFAALPFTTGLSPQFRVLVAFGVALFVALPVAYLSYQFVERPFLQRRRRVAERAETTFGQRKPQRSFAESPAGERLT